QINQVMYLRNHQEGSAIKRVRPGGENANSSIGFQPISGLPSRRCRCHGKIDLCAFASTNPVALELFDSLGPIEGVELNEQPLGIRSDAQHPLSHGPSNNRKTPNLAFSVNNFLVRQYCAQFRTPVDRDIREISESNAVRISSVIG